MIEQRTAVDVDDLYVESVASENTQAFADFQRITAYSRAAIAEANLVEGLRRRLKRANANDQKQSPENDHGAASA